MIQQIVGINKNMKNNLKAIGEAALLLAMMVLVAILYIVIK
jgi:hypothetical protein